MQCMIIMSRLNTTVAHMLWSYILSYISIPFFVSLSFILPLWPPHCPLGCQVTYHVSGVVYLHATMPIPPSPPASFFLVLR